jgi:tryptophan-rich sensory protein
MYIPAWLVIGAVAFLVTLGSAWVSPEDNRWFRRLRRPRWLTFEFLIPLIWTSIFICAAWSAVLTWNAAPRKATTWGLMLGYLLLEVVVIAYVPVTLRLRSLWWGTGIGGLGFFIGLALCGFVWPLSALAGGLLIPYLLWSPIGTYTTYVMAKLNAEPESSDPDISKPTDTQ